MPALNRAQQVSIRAARAGFEWPNFESVRAKVNEELDEFEQAESQEDRESEFGDLLFTLVNIARWNGIDAEQSLRKMVNRFQSRFEWMEAHATKSLDELTLEEWDSLWKEAKKSHNL